ncbi:class I SAM-dependent methyltransferase [Dongia sp.]|uniref:class I SAM-dependent methyltransferase n=1 Tax=Dongia sp. TaxID=1977262 RepID=UPI0035B1E132
MPEQTPEQTKEAQYDVCFSVRDAVGFQRLGLMTNQVWYDDPRRMVFTLSRYKFVSKMLSGYRKVAELGCGDGFGSRIVRQEVSALDLYDFDPIFVADVNANQVDRWNCRARTADILAAPLPGTYDGIYSLDVIEHIAPKQEHLYVENLQASLNEFGVLIVGSPSLESQTYASPPSKAGHINCKTGKDLKALMARYFHNVFLFSMNDEVVHTGFAPMAHYLIAVCTGKRS